MDLRPAKASLHKHLRRPIVLAEATLARKTVHLAPEPPGERVGVVTPTGERLPADAAVDRPAGRPLTFVGIGDSTVAGCGCYRQDVGFIPQLAAGVARATGRDVIWSTHAQLGATMRRVRYRFVPEVKPCDILVISGGSNDAMAGRSIEEWTEDFEVVLDECEALSKHVIVVGAGPLTQSPSLMRWLREALGDLVDEQVHTAEELCAPRGIPYIDVAHRVLAEGYWASDDFHPGETGYGQVADLVVPRILESLRRNPDPVAP